jgi:hypothetical protein
MLVPWLGLTALLLTLGLGQAGRWVFLGGYSGLEGGRARSSGIVETLDLELPEAAAMSDRFRWCSGNVSTLPIDIDGHTMSEVNVIEYVRNKVKNTNVNFDAAHHTTQFHRILVCGGADNAYNVKNTCKWWLPERNLWEEGPLMMRPRYQAAAVSWPGEGIVWMLGGRDGSTILQDNEVLIYPEVRKNRFTAKRWEWAHKKMKNIEVWNSGVPGDMRFTPKHAGMKVLPLPLAGHCAVDIGGRVAVVGGGTLADHSNEIIIQNSPLVPTDHVHFYNRADQKWSSTFESDLVTGSLRVTKLGIPRMNHACLVIGNKLYVAGGVTNDTSGQRLVLNSVERYDVSSDSWSFLARLPQRLTGIKLIEVAGRPVVVGRYGTELTEQLLRYSTDQIWEVLPTNMLAGRSDFQVLQQAPSRIWLFPNMNSKTTKMNPGSGGDWNWRNLFGAVTAGVRKTWRTNQHNQPWVQLDMGAEVLVHKVGQMN